MPAAACELCKDIGGELLHEGARFRVVLVDDPRYPGFCRVIWNEHVKEMTDLAAEDREMLMWVVWQVETAVREVMRPNKVNLASLGNVTPHVHWHIIPRYSDDTHFPNPIWAEAKRVPDEASVSKRAALLPALRDAVRKIKFPSAW
jgi:diadenosine tetraphosphate (Ap4A) HIT family hydrolase